MSTSPAHRVAPAAPTIPTSDAGTNRARTVPGDTDTGAKRRRDLLGGRLAIAYGAIAMAIGAAQVVRSGDTSEQIAPGMRVLLVAFSISLVLLAPTMLALARYARSRTGARVAAVGAPLLAVGAMSSAVNGTDLSWFPYVAVVANGLWFLGSVMLGVSLWRARRVPRWVAVLLPVTVPVTILLSQLGGGLLAGAFWVAVGSLTAAGRLQPGNDTARRP